MKNTTPNRTQRRKKSKGSKPALFTIRQDFRGFVLSYYEHGNGKNVEGLPGNCETVFDLMDAWPRILAWLKARKCRSLCVSLPTATDTFGPFCEIDHADGELHSVSTQVKWIAHARPA